MNKHDGWTENRSRWARLNAPDYNEGDSRGGSRPAAVGAFGCGPHPAVGQLLGQRCHGRRLAAPGHHARRERRERAAGTERADRRRGLQRADSREPDGRPAPGTDCFGYRDTDGDPFEGDYDRDGRVETEASGGSLNIDWDVGDVTITSITAYQKVERLQSEDTEASPFPLIQPTFGAETTTFTQELRAAGGSDAFRWLVGGFYFDNEVDGHYLLDLTNLEFVFFDAVYTQESESLAAFGQVEFDLSDRFTFIAGARCVERPEGARLPEHRRRQACSNSLPAPTRRVRLRQDQRRRPRRARRRLGERQGRARLQAERRRAAVRLGLARHQAGRLQRRLPRPER